MTETEAGADVHDATSVPALWDAARWFLGRLLAICGTPRALAAEPVLSLKERRKILHWLRPVEGLVRRLLVVEAARIAREAATRRKRGKRGGTNNRPSRPRFCRVNFPDPENSSTWAVRFSLRERPIRRRSPRWSPRLRFLDLDDHAGLLAPAALKRAIAQHRAKTPCTEEIPPHARMRPRRRPAADNPWRLARRVEAVARVLENPEPYARRLARRLPETADRLARACRPPPLLPPDEPPRPAETCFRQASEHALEALAAFGSGGSGFRTPAPEGAA